MSKQTKEPDEPQTAILSPWLKPTAEPAAKVARRQEAASFVVPRVCLSRSEAAQALGIGDSTLKALEREGDAPPAFKVSGGRRLYPLNLLIEWAAHRAQARELDRDGAT
jgi:Helix-turn-helix domain